MTSMSAMDRKRPPENVMARSMVFLLLKHASEETKLPKIVTSRKKTSIRTILIIRVPSI
jgi:hypothetical protein